MKINVKIIPNSKKDAIVKDDGKLKIHLKARAVNNEANKYLIEVLAEYYNKRKTEIRIVKGFKSRNKVVEIV